MPIPPGSAFEVIETGSAAGNPARKSIASNDGRQGAPRDFAGTGVVVYHIVRMG
jgi:hypothetical protein